MAVVTSNSLCSPQEPRAAIAAGAFGSADRDRRRWRENGLRDIDARRLRVVERVVEIEHWLRLPHQPVRPGQLRAFARFRVLDDTRLKALAARSLVYAAPRGTRLLERGGRDAWNLFLLEGSLLLTPDDERARLRVEGGSERAGDPVIFLKPRRYTVDTVTAVSFLWMHDLLLAALPGDCRRV